jgi:hypothetical protein
VKWRKTARVVGGMVLILLGLLWILQGADVARTRPILCFGDCQPITGGSPGWLAIGVVTLVVGLRVAGVLRGDASGVAHRSSPIGPPWDAHAINELSPRRSLQDHWPCREEPQGARQVALALNTAGPRLWHS